MVGRRQLLLGLGAAILGVGLLTAILTARGDRDEDVAAAGTRATTTTASSSTTTTSPRPATTTSSPTTTTAAPTAATEPTAPRPPTTVATPAAPAAPTASIAPSPAAPAPPAPAPPPFQSSIEIVTTAQLGSSWRAGLGCPGADQLRALDLSHWGYDGAVHQGRLIVAAGHAERIVAVFRDLYAARFPIQRMVPVDAYGGDDGASMRANNTSGFNCRTVAGSSTLSEHGKGLAVDVNPLVNPYVSSGGSVDPPEGAPYADRSRGATGMIHAGDAVVAAFARQGWGWGGSWSSAKDYQHFSASGR